MHAGRQLQFERLLFFSDAVFAIAITLLVIEIRLPEGHYRTDTDILNGLLALIPNYVGFLISFFVVGRFWVGHHSLFATAHDEFDSGLVWRNLLFLGCIAFFPFPTAVLSQFASSRVAVMFYALWLLLAGLLNWLLFARVARLNGIRDRARTLASLLPAMIGGAAALAALVHPLAGLLTLMFSPAVLRIYDRLIRPRLSRQTSASA